jgi:hypothetical protein
MKGFEKVPFVMGAGKRRCVICIADLLGKDAT